MSGIVAPIGGAPVTRTVARHVHARCGDEQREVRDQRGVAQRELQREVAAHRLARHDAGLGDALGDMVDELFVALQARIRRYGAEAG